VSVSFGSYPLTRRPTSGKAVKTMLHIDKGKPTTAKQGILTHSEIRGRGSNN